MSEVKKFFPCSCTREVIGVCTFTDDLPATIFFSVYRDFPTLGWKTRLRHIWHIVTTGSPFSDQAVLDAETAQALGEYLIAISK